MSRLNLWVGAILAALFIAAAISCDAGAESLPVSPEATVASTQELSPEPTDQPIAEPTPAPEGVFGSQFASHLFASPGDVVDISAYGKFLAQVDLSDPPAVTVSGGQATVERSGISCLRFEYRRMFAEGPIQTQCIVGFDETGSCAGLEPLSLDLEQYAPVEQIPEGSHANLLETGEGVFYATCKTADGRYRLQQPSDYTLPPLYLQMVDAYGLGPYSYGSEEFGLYRDAVVETFSGELLRPSQTHVMAAESNTLNFGPEGFEFVFDDCRFVPACSGDLDVVQPGDIVTITWSAPMDRMMEILAGRADNGYKQWFTERTGTEWEKVENVNPETQFEVFVRLLSVDAMDAAIQMFDELYDLRTRQVPVVYLPFWPVYDVTGKCPREGEEWETCLELEEMLQGIDADHIQGLKDAGFEVWRGGGADYGFEGEVLTWRDEKRPVMDLFDGYFISVAANQWQPKELVPDILAEVMTAMAKDMDDGKPVHLQVGGPMTGSTIAEFCEADICTSDFDSLYEQFEAWMKAALDSFAPGQITGLSVSLFDGTHYDVLNPYEQIDLVLLNRAGETGYNNPVLNIYRAQ